MVVREREKLLVPYRSDIDNIIEDAKFLEHDGKQLLALDHVPGNVKLLRNMGIKAPSPIFYQYDWAGDLPYDSQKTTAAMLSIEPRAYVLSSMGVGKTRAALYAFDFLKRQNIIDKLLVVAPLSTLVPVWDNEIFSVFPHLTTMTLHGTRKQRLIRLKESADCYIINHDGVSVIDANLLSMLSKDRYALIVDELSAYKNARTKRWRVLKPLVNKSVCAWGLTGSPTPQAPTDAFGQVKLLTPDRVPVSFLGFKRETMTQVTQFKWVPKKTANKTVFRAMRPAVRFTLDECHDLPPLTYSVREVQPTRNQLKAHKQLLEEYAMDMLSGEEITVVNEAARLNKLLQLYCGFVYDAEGKGHYLGAEARIRLVLELAEEADGKVIVFSPYKWAVKALYHVLHSKYPDEIRMVHGGVPAAARSSYFTEFQRSKYPRVIVAHPGCMSHGLTLTAANTIVWYSPTHSVETYIQANARIHRPGQKKHSHIIHITSSHLENRVYNRLKKRERTQGLLLDMFKNKEL